jgi:hypothetical protein
MQNTIAISLTKSLNTIKKRLQDELKAQGHELTGALSNSIRWDIVVEGDRTTATMYALGYGIIIETGVKANRIPYSGNRGRGGKSKYIEGLIKFFKLKGKGEREAKSAAFATARKQKREGMPTRGSYAHTRNGRRTGFVTAVLKESMGDIADMLEKDYGARIAFELNQEVSVDFLVLNIG